jgi:hypothetical protein
MAELFRHYLYYTFHSLGKYDYMAIGWVLFLSLLLMLLGAFVRRRSLSFTLLFIGLFLFFVGPPTIKAVMDRYLRAADVTVTSVKVLSYSHAAAIEGTLKNRGKIDFSRCDLVLIFHAPAHDALSSLKAYLKPYEIRIETLQFPLVVGEEKPFSLLLDGYDRQPFELTPIARCYP